MARRITLIWFILTHNNSLFSEIDSFDSLIQEEANRGKPNWEHLNDELHVLITVEDSENRAKLKLERAVEEVKKLLTVVSASFFFGLSTVPYDMSHILCPY